MLPSLWEGMISKNFNNILLMKWRETENKTDNNGLAAFRTDSMSLQDIYQLQAYQHWTLFRSLIDEKLALGMMCQS